MNDVYDSNAEYTRNNDGNKHAQYDVADDGAYNDNAGYDKTDSNDDAGSEDDGNENGGADTIIR